MSVVPFLAGHAVVGAAGAFAVASGTANPSAALTYLWSLGLVSAVISGICFAATNRYLSRSGGSIPGLAVGGLCGALSSVMIGLALLGISLSLAQFLAVFVPGIMAVLLASLVDSTASAWHFQKGRRRPDASHAEFKAPPQ